MVKHREVCKIWSSEMDAIRGLIAVADNKHSKFSTWGFNSLIIFTLGKSNYRFHLYSIRALRNIIYQLVNNIH